MVSMGCNKEVFFLMLFYVAKNCNWQLTLEEMFHSSIKNARNALRRPGIETMILWNCEVQILIIQLLMDVGSLNFS